MADYQDRLRELALSDSGFLFDPFSGATFNTNAVGRTILEALKEGAGRRQVVERLAEAFEQPPQGWDLDRDVDEFVLMLRENGILPHEFQLKP